MKTIILLIMLFTNSIFSEENTRIVSLNGSVTEILFELGAGSLVVGCDTSSLYPEQATKLPKIGYQRAISPEGILSLNPTLVVGTSDAGPPTAIEQLKRSGAKVNIFHDFVGIDSVWKKIEFIGSSIGKNQEAERLLQKLKKENKTLLEKISYTKKPKVLFIYARGINTIQVSGNNTQASEMIRLAGGVNAINEFDGFKPLTPEALAISKIDYILMPEMSLSSMGGANELKKIPALSVISNLESKLITMDDLLLLGFSARINKAIHELAKKIGTL
ncbi:MAG: ABC transporter substrate-binding protein [Leptospiraceae bacterium]|nr:ABC transporter substrate-binding protein [Leptospiraceae bacterium]